MPASDLTDVNGSFEGTASDRTGQVIGRVVIADAAPGESVHLSLSDATNGEVTTSAGLADGTDLGSRFTVTTSAESGTFIAAVSMTFPAGAFGALGLAPGDLELHVLDDDPTPPVWVPAGANVGESPLTGALGESGFETDADGSVTYWAVRDRLSVFAVGSAPVTEAPEPEPDSPEPMEAPESGQPTSEPVTDDLDEPIVPMCGSGVCGLGGGQMMLMSLFGLCLMRFVARRRVF